AGRLRSRHSAPARSRPHTTSRRSRRRHTPRSIPGGSAASSARPQRVSPAGSGLTLGIAIRRSASARTRPGSNATAARCPTAGGSARRTGGSLRRPRDRAARLHVLLRGFAEQPLVEPRADVVLVLHPVARDPASRQLVVLAREAHHDHRLPLLLEC